MRTDEQHGNHRQALLRLVGALPPDDPPGSGAVVLHVLANWSPVYCRRSSLAA